MACRSLESREACSHPAHTAAFEPSEQEFPDSPEWRLAGVGRQRLPHSSSFHSPPPPLLHSLLSPSTSPASPALSPPFLPPLSFTSSSRLRGAGVGEGRAAGKREWEEPTGAPRSLSTWTGAFFTLSVGLAPKRQKAGPASQSLPKGRPRCFNYSCRHSKSTHAY